jgi:hypothetical protein
MRYHCVNIPEIIFRYIAGLTLAPVQQSRTAYFKLLFQTTVKDIKHMFQSCDRSFIACLTLCRQCAGLSILQRCTISRLYRNFLRRVKHKHFFFIFYFLFLLQLQLQPVLHHLAFHGIFTAVWLRIKLIVSCVDVVFR